MSRREARANGCNESCRCVKERNRQLETFTKPKGFVDNPRYLQQRQAVLSTLDTDRIDGPIVDIVKSFQDFPYCFTLQSCYGHFMHAGQQDRNNTVRLHIANGSAVVTYRIAYVALCIENSPEGKGLFEDLREISTVDPEFVQFGSAEWFWGRQVNSDALQVEPRRFMDKDEITVDYQEALRIQDVRDSIFSEFRKLPHRKA